MLVLLYKMYNKSKDKIVSNTPSAVKKTLANHPKVVQKQTVSNILPTISTKNSVSKIQKMNSTSVKKYISQKIIQNVPIYKRQTKRPPVNSKIKAKLPQNNMKITWSNIPLNILIEISEYCSYVPFDVYKLSLVCSTWRQLLSCQNAIYFWKKFKKTENAKNFIEFKKCLQLQLVEVKQKRSVEFQTMFTKLFNYGSTKQNIPNKLISRLKLQMQVVINKKRYPSYPFKLRTFNFSSYLYAKINELNQIAFDMYTPHNFFKDNLEITIHFYSRAYKVSHKLQYKFQPTQIADCAIRQKAFNYFIAKNLIITYFQGDNSFLYCFLEISILELITQFRKIIKNSFKEHIDQKMKKVPMYKKLCETEFQNFREYIKFQADFEVHMSYHNSVRQIFTHCDTKVFPLQYDDKQAYFDIKIDDTFQKTSTFMLDNKMGMSEKIDDLYLLDFILKDRDRFLIVFSGFIYARDANQKERQSIDNFFQFIQCPIKMIQYKGNKYKFSIMVIEQKRKNFIKHARFYLYP